jgi:ion channel POLLUX/CASTOR
MPKPAFGERLRDRFDNTLASGNRNRAEVARADDFIISNRLISLMLAQVSENKALNAVFTDIFDPEGAEIYLKPARDYVQLGVPVTFHTVIEAAFGYRIAILAGNKAENYGVKLNPSKAGLVTFERGDRVLVFAES